MRLVTLTLASIALLQLGCAGHPADARRSSGPESTGSSAPAERSAAVATQGVPARSFAVRVIGHGPPMVLIPGLGGSDESWREAIARYRSRYQLHLVTPAGFAGVPTIEPPLLGTVESDVITYIQANSLHKPIILGHSLGAFMAFSIAAAAPDQVGPIIAIDGTPFGAALRDEHADVSNQLQRATALRDQFWNTPPEQVEAQTRKLFAPMFTNTEDLERILPDVLKSSQIALGQALYELRTTDLRKPVGAIKTPVLLIVAGQHFTDDANPDLTRYQQTMAHIADREIYVARGTRHFAMVDAPALVYGKIDSFLATRSASGDK